MKIYLRLGIFFIIVIAGAGIIHPQTIAANQPTVVAAVAPIFPAIAIAAKPQRTLLST